MSERRAVSGQPYQKGRKTPKSKKGLIIAGIIIAVIAISASMLWFGNVRAPKVDRNEAGSKGQEYTRPEGVYNVLVVGKDKIAMNTDTLILASLDTRTGKANLLSIPRDTMSNVTRKNKKINAAYGRTGKGDINNLLEEIEGLIGFRPDNYVMIDLDGFVGLIDEIGGVQIDVPRDMKYDDPAQNLHIDIKKGSQVLDGKTAMGFVRYRHGYAEGDIGRVKAQQLFIKAIAKQMMNPANITKINSYATFAMNHVKTDLSMGEMVWFGTQLIKMDADTDIQTFMLPGAPLTYKKLSYYVINEEKALKVINENFNPYDKSISDLDLIDIKSDSDKTEAKPTSSGTTKKEPDSTTTAPDENDKDSSEEQPEDGADQIPD